MGKYIIVDSYLPNTGKTKVMNELWDLLPSYLPPAINSGKEIFSSLSSNEIIGTDTPDFPKKMHYIGRRAKIGINSIGDSIIHIVGGLIFLLKKECDIIVCTCHTEAALRKAIINFDTTFGRKPNDRDEKFWRKMFINHLGKDVTDQEIKELKDDVLSQYTIITTSHFCVVDPYQPHKPNSIKLPISVGSCNNLNRLSAFHILDLIERLVS